MSRRRASTSSCAATCGRWCARLRESGVTIILTTHYIDEAEEMADRIGVINKGELIVVEEKTELMKKLGKKQLTLNLLEPLAVHPVGAERLASGAEGRRTASWNTPSTATKSAPAFRRCSSDLSDLGIGFKDLNTHQSSLEDIFVSLVSERTGDQP